MANEWNHTICEPCFRKHISETRIPVRELHAGRQRCCFCAMTTDSGIYVRYDPVAPELLCAGRPKDFHRRLNVK